MSTYYAQLRDPRWQKMRLTIMGRDKFTCRLCGDAASTLNVHHLYYTKGAAPWEYPESSLVTLCENCHGGLHEFNPGAQMVEALIAGNASLIDIFCFADVLFTSLADGPHPARFTQDQWTRLRAGLSAMFFAVEKGHSDADVGAVVAADMAMAGKYQGPL